MSRKDYIALAHAISISGMGDNTREELVRNISDVLAADNAHFNRARFREACFVNPSAK